MVTLPPGLALRRDIRRLGFLVQGSRIYFCRSATGRPTDHRRPGLGVGGTRAHEIDLEGIAIRPIKRVQMLNTATGLVVDDANKLDQRRSSMQSKRLGNVWCRQPGTDALARMLHFHAGPLEQLK